MNKQHNGPGSRTDAANKTGLGLQQQHSVTLSDIDRERSVMHRMVLSIVMAFPAIMAAMFVTILHVGMLWHYIWLTTCLVFSILALIEVYLLGKEIGQHRYPQDCA